MRTTIDLPDDLLRRAKATAALRGQKLKELVAALIERGLDSAEVAPDARGHRAPLPHFRCLDGARVSNLTNDTIEGALTAEDLNRLDTGRPA